MSRDMITFFRTKALKHLSSSRQAVGIHHGCLPYFIGLELTLQALYEVVHSGTLVLCSVGLESSGRRSYSTRDDKKVVNPLLNCSFYVCKSADENHQRTKKQVHLLPFANNFQKGRSRTPSPPVNLSLWGVWNRGKGVSPPNCVSYIYVLIALYTSSASRHLHDLELYLSHWS